MSTDLSTILVINDVVPDDFYKNSKHYEAQLDLALVTAQSLCHELSDDGRKRAKSDVALIRKYTSVSNKHALSVFRSLTDKVQAWRSGITDKTKALDLEADAIMSRFEELETAKLTTIRSLLTDTLNNEWNEQDIDPEFRVADLEPLVKLNGTLTEAGNLTSKAKDAILGMVNENRVRQHKIESRLLFLENRCLRDDITPLSKGHLGNYLYAEEAVFNAQVDKLIEAELARISDLQARIEARTQAENKRKLDDALKAQQQEVREAARIEAARVMEQGRQAAEALKAHTQQEALAVDREIEKQSQVAPVSKNDNRTAAWSINDSSLTPRRTKPDLQSVKSILEVSAPTLPKALPEKRTVKVTAVFNFNGISSRVSSKAVVDHFIKLLGDCPKLKDGLESAISIDLLVGEQHEPSARSNVG